MSTMNSEQLDLLHQARIAKDAVHEAMSGYNTAIAEAKAAGLTITDIIQYARGD